MNRLTPFMFLYSTFAGRIPWDYTEMIGIALTNIFYTQIVNRNILYG